MGKPKLLVICGPTASGKSELAHRLFGVEARRIMRLGAAFTPAAEIISADSMQVYRGMDIGTAKPGPEERSDIPYHLIDEREIHQQFSCGEFIQRAEALLAQISGRAGLSLMVGGTMFYIKSFLMGRIAAPPSNPEIREEIRRELNQRGAAALHQELCRLDSQSAMRIHPNDAYRLTRALEVCRLSGMPLSSFAPPSSARADIDALVLGIAREKPDLYARIDARVDRLFDMGLAQELASLRKAGFGPEDPGMQAIGYREFFLGENEAGIREAIKKNSRAYSKRQMTFMKTLPGIELYRADDEAGIIERVSAWLGLGKMAKRPGAGD